MLFDVTQTRCQMAHFRSVTHNHFNIPKRHQAASSRHPHPPTTMPRSESKSSRDDEDADEKDAKGRRDGGDDDDGSALIKKVISYFFDDDPFAHTFERFAEEHCAIFDPESDEMKLEYTEIYNQFQELFESKIEDFIRSQGASVQQFYQHVRDAYERDRESSLVLCSEILVATADFDVFVLMMKQTNESMRLAKHAR